jgi:ethanolamine permease
MYIISMISLFVLRRKTPEMDRPFVAPFYPYFPALALLLSVICLLSIIYFNLLLSAVFFGTMLLLVLLFVTSGKHKKLSSHFDVNKFA